MELHYVAVENINQVIEAHVHVVIVYMFGLRPFGTSTREPKSSKSTTPLFEKHTHYPAGFSLVPHRKPEDEQGYYRCTFMLIVNFIKHACMLHACMYICYAIEGQFGHEWSETSLVLYHRLYIQ